MFKCDKCGKTTAPREKQTKRITGTRPVCYGICTKKKDTRHIGDEIWGSEIVREINLCEDCKGDTC